MEDKKRGEKSKSQTGIWNTNENAADENVFFMSTVYGDSSRRNVNIVSQSSGDAFLAEWIPFT